LRLTRTVFEAIPLFENAQGGMFGDAKNERETKEAEPSTWCRRKGRAL
jgi:hypothetical protein